MEIMNGCENKESKKQNRIIYVVMQAFYGNRTETDIYAEGDDVDRRIQGRMSQDDTIPLRYPVDRTLVTIPGSEHLVIIYNKYQEEERRREREEYIRECGRGPQPLAVIPEKGIEIYSRCLACRIDKEGALQSLEDEDYEIVMKYLAK